MNPRSRNASTRQRKRRAGYENGCGLGNALTPGKREAGPQGIGAVSQWRLRNPSGPGAALASLPGFGWTAFTGRESAGALALAVRRRPGRVANNKEKPEKDTGGGHGVPKSHTGYRASGCSPSARSWRA